MKLLVVLVFLNILGVASYSQGFLRPYDQKLDSLFRLWKQSPDSLERQKEFFDNFPANFEDFRKTYDYKKLAHDPMYYLADDHIMNGFAKLSKIPSKEYYGRLIDLSIGGKWNADAINFLQYFVHQKTEENPDLLFSLLSDYTTSQMYSFWFFYFNSLYPMKGGIPKYLLNMRVRYPVIYKEMQKAFKASDGKAMPYSD